MEHHRAIVLANGDPVAGTPALPDRATVIAADGGLSLAAPLGLRVDLVIGDMDSVDEDDLEQARRSGTRVERHPAEKSITDLGLALDAAIAGGATDITIVGGSGGRLDHLIANAMLIGSERYSTVAIRWLTGAESVMVAGPGRTAEIAGEAGNVVSLIPVGGAAQGITTTGLRWPLNGGGLAPGSTRGISNEMIGAEAAIEVDDCVLLIVHEGGG